MEEEQINNPSFMLFFKLCPRDGILAERKLVSNLGCSYAAAESATSA